MLLLMLLSFALTDLQPPLLSNLQQVMMVMVSMSVLVMLLCDGDGDNIMGNGECGDVDVMVRHGGAAVLDGTIINCK